MSGQLKGSSRYELLDSWRGIAALAVVGFHSINQLVQPERNWIASLLWLGWGGVYIFFPISGYCILAASHSGGSRTVGLFLRRRWRRIFPTYWASIALTVIVTLVFAPFSRGSVSVLVEPGLKWLSIATLTQTFTNMASAINPVYWSLCYEEQFYLVIAATLAVPASYRPLLLLSVSAAAAAVSGLHISVPAGLFLDRWLNFAVGLAVFGWFDSRYGKRWSATILAVAIGVAAAGRQGELAISIVAAVLFIALRPYDRVVAASLPARALAAVGVFSYSLYLTHVPIAGRIVNFSRRFVPEAADKWPFIVVAASAVSLVCARAFYQAVEKRFQNSPSASPLRVPVVAERAVVA